MTEIPVTCQHCTKPVFKIDTYSRWIVVRVRHHGEQHESVIPFEIIESQLNDEVEEYNALRRH